MPDDATTDSAVDVSAIPPLGHAEAMRLARTEYGRFCDLVDGLAEEDWSKPTCCPGWSVRDMAGHVLGSMRSSARISEQVGQLRVARRFDGSMADGLTAEQIRITAALPTDELRAELRATIDAAVRGRRGVPGPARRWVRMGVELPVSGRTESWRLGYLTDAVLTRDTWMHRSDIAAATGQPFVFTADHDGRLVATVVADWADRLGQDVRLELDGPGLGALRSGPEGSASIRADAVAFCRGLSGRDGGPALGVEVPF